MNFPPQLYYEILDYIVEHETVEVEHKERRYNIKGSGSKGIFKYDVYSLKTGIIESELIKDLSEGNVKAETIYYVLQIMESTDVIDRRLYSDLEHKYHYNDSDYKIYLTSAGYKQYLKCHEII